MKYPENQFNQLKKSMISLSYFFDLKSVHPCQIHYLVYEQYSQGQTHNWIYVLPNGTLKRAHHMNDAEIKEAKKILPENCTFELYPDNCKDNHVEAAVKKALKEIYK